MCISRQKKLPGELISEEGRVDAKLLHFIQRIFTMLKIFILKNIFDGPTGFIKTFYTK